MGYKLKNARLLVDIRDIQTGDSRFDRTGFITQVTLDNKNSFCVGEHLQKQTGGRGLCNEFGIFTPVDYYQTRPAEKFTKIGVGMLTRQSETEYNFYHDYQVDPFHIDVSQPSQTEIVFAYKCHTGTKHKLIKSIKLFDNSVTINYQLHNQSERVIKTEEYCHNFLGINKQLFDKSYVLIFRDNTITWDSPPQEAYFRKFQINVSEHQFFWELRNDVFAVGVSETVDFIPKYLNLWGNAHVVSPEIFINIEVHPNQTQAWTRKFEFFIF